MSQYSRHRYSVDLDDLRLEHEQAKKAQEMKKTSYGVDLEQDNSSLYVVQRLEGDFFLCSERFDCPSCSWVRIHKDNFWSLV